MDLIFLNKLKLKKIDHVVTLLNRLKKLDFELDIEVVIA
jgi:hypothetical protein